MNELITRNSEQIHRLCLKYKVRRLEVFGSTCDGRFKPAASDIDFLVEFLPLKDDEHADTYFGLLEELHDLLGRPVDLVMTKAASNPYFLLAIAPTRTELYAA